MEFDHLLVHAVENHFGIHRDFPLNRGCNQLLRSYRETDAIEAHIHPRDPVAFKLDDRFITYFLKVEEQPPNFIMLYD